LDSRAAEENLGSESELDARGAEGDKGETQRSVSRVVGTTKGHQWSFTYTAAET
jgi:hypothetical protein